MERSDKGDGAEARRDGSRRGQMHLLGTSSSWATLLIAGRTLSQVRPRALPSPHAAPPPPNRVELCPPVHCEVGKVQRTHRGAGLGALEVYRLKDAACKFIRCSLRVSSQSAAVAAEESAGASVLDCGEVWTDGGVCAAGRGKWWVLQCVEL
jgi:hypothetical protein